MSKRPLPPDDYKPLASLAIKSIAGANGQQKIAFHLSGKLDDERPPLICLADYYRNMADYLGFIKRLHNGTDADWPIVLIDLAGRGRSTDRRDRSKYTSDNDANDVACVAAALGIENAVILGQGHGGRVAMMLACRNSHLICGSVLIDAAPVLYAPGLVRLRDNLKLLLAIRNPKQFNSAAHQIFGLAHPGLTQSELDEIAQRTFFRRKSGRVMPMFDPALLRRLQQIQINDVFEAQWPLFATLNKAPMMLMRTQLSDQLERAAFEKMGMLRSDAVQLVIPGQGSPALLSGEDEVGAIMDFVHHCARQTKCRAIVTG